MPVPSRKRYRQAPAPTTRSAEPLMRGKALKVPAIYRRGHEGMIKLPE